MRFALICFAATAPLAAQAQPAITSGRISQATIDVTRPSASPAITLNITGTATFIAVQYQSPSAIQASESFISQNSGHAEPGAGYTGKVLLQGYTNMFNSNGGVLSLYAEPGTWTVTNISVCSNTGGCSQYSGAALTAIFPKITFPVANPGTADVVAPTASSATVLTPTVSIASGTQPAAIVHAADNLSGVNAVAVFASLPDFAAGLSLNSEVATRPATSGAFRVTATLQPNTPTGTYTIQTVIASDNAGNTASITDPATIAKLFNNHTTITVTN